MIPRIEPTAVGIAALGAVLEVAREREPRAPAAAVLDATIACGDARANQERLAEGALVVTTGQQPGLLGGPLYTIYKALAAAAVAERLEAELGQPVVPVFWVTGDDHDFHEANHATILTVQNELVDLVLRERPSDAALTPLANELLGPEIQAVLAELAEATPETEFKGEVMGWLSRCYRPEVSIAEASAVALAELLGPAGVVVFRGAAPGAKAVSAPILREALRRDVHRLVLPGEVPTPRDATLVMLVGKLGRDRLLQEDRTFRLRRSGEQWTLAALERILDEEPERFSPNVLLRAVVEAYLWPTVAYIAGPAELAYLPQVAPVYEALDVPRQVPLARFGALLIEHKVAKVLDKFGIAFRELAASPGRLEARLVKQALPRETLEAFEDLRRWIERGYGRLTDATVAVDPTMRTPFEGAKRSALTGLAGLEKRLVSHLKQRNETLVQQIEKARVNLFPRGREQERVFSWPMYAIRYGDELYRGIWAEAQAWARAIPLEAPTGAT